MRLRALVFRARDEQSMDEELRLHVQLEAERLQAGGLSPRAARRKALRDFGGIEQIKEISRDVPGTTSVDAVVRDVRQSTRRLIRDWRFTAAAVLILGSRHRRHDGDLQPGERGPVQPDGRRRAGAAGGDLSERPREPGAHGELVSGVSGHGGVHRRLCQCDRRDASRRRHLPGRHRGPAAGRHRVHHLHLPRPRWASGPSLGRWFDASEEVSGAPIVVVVGHAAWLQKFGADPSIVGRSIRLDGVPATIVGVGPAGHNGTLPVGVFTDFWVPTSAIVALGRPARMLDAPPTRGPSS